MGRAFVLIEQIEKLLEISPETLPPEQPGAESPSDDSDTYPSIEQMLSRVSEDLGAWEEVVQTFPEDVKDEVEGLIYKMESSDGFDASPIKQLVLIFKENVKDEKGKPVVDALQFVANILQLAPAAHEMVVDAHLGDDEEEEPAEGGGTDEA